MSNNENEFSIRLTLSRIMNELNKKIDRIRKPNGKTKFTKVEFFNRCEYGEIKDFPFSRDTYYGYSAVAGGKESREKIQSMDLRRFYDICIYLNVSADYLLGFNTSKRKELSAEKVKKEFGLSDKSMGRLAELNKNTPKFKGDLSSDIVNAILESDTFWDKLKEYLPIYIACINEVRANNVDADIARYGMSKTFEELIDEICAFIDKKNMPYNKLDETDIVYR